MLPISGMSAHGQAVLPKAGPRRTGAESVGRRQNEGAGQGPAWRGVGEISTGLGGLEGQAGVGADSKLLNSPSQPYEAQPLCLFTRGTTLGPRKGHICSLKQKQTRSPPPRVQGPGAGIERRSGHGSCSGRAVIPSLRWSVIHGGESLPFCLTDADTEPQRGCVHRLTSHSQSLRGRALARGLAF